MTTLPNTNQTARYTLGGVRALVASGASEANNICSADKLVGGLKSSEVSGGSLKAVQTAATVSKAISQDGVEEIRRGADRSLQTLFVTSCSELFRTEAMVPWGLPCFRTFFGNCAYP